MMFVNLSSKNVSFGIYTVNDPLDKIKPNTENKGIFMDNLEIIIPSLIVGLLCAVVAVNIYFKKKKK